MVKNKDVLTEFLKKRDPSTTELAIIKAQHIHLKAVEKINGIRIELLMIVNIFPDDKSTILWGIRKSTSENRIESLGLLSKVASIYEEEIRKLRSNND